MKYFKPFIFFLALVVGFSGCDEDDSVLDDSRPLVKFHFDLRNSNFNHCHTIVSITFIVFDELTGTQESYDVANNNSREFDFNTRKGELVSFTAYDTNDATNTILASANIPSDNYDESPDVNNVQVYFTRCPSIDKILWSSY